MVETMALSPRLSTIFFGLFGLKMLLSFCYVSTDFEVHRNWLAVTYNLPVKKWYVENTSIWTLDYPPFFAWFEYGCARVGALFLLNDTSSAPPVNSPLGIRPENSTSVDVSILIYQRFTVIAADLVFIFGIYYCLQSMFQSGNDRMIPLPASRKELGKRVLWLLLSCNVGLLFVDSIHFQYNGFLFGFLLLSFACIGNQRYLTGAFLFAVLLNLKHIFLYLAPAYAAYYFRNYCFPSEEKNDPKRVSCQRGALKKSNQYEKSKKSGQEENFKVSDEDEEFEVSDEEEELKVSDEHENSKEWNRVGMNYCFSPEEKRGPKRKLDRHGESEDLGQYEEPYQQHQHQESKEVDQHEGPNELNEHEESREPINPLYERRPFWSFSPLNFLKLIAVGTVVFLLSFGPFIHFGQMAQLLARLFPFKRGLTHAYWAPNFWALYNAIDYVLLIIYKRIGWIDYHVSVPGYATGLVQEFDHLVLPSVKPITTFIITALTMAPACLVVALKRTGWDGFVHLVTLCAFSSFLFGWHVHEKAVLMVLIPLSLLTVIDYRFGRIFLLISVSGQFSLFPLLFRPFESPIKYCTFVVYIIGAFYGLQSVYKLPTGSGLVRFLKLPFLTVPETLYVYGFVPLELLCTLLNYHPELSKKFAFAPLMLTSVYCAIGVVYCWLLLYWALLCRVIHVDERYQMIRWHRQRLRLKMKAQIENEQQAERTLDEKTGVNQLRFIGGLDVSTAVEDNRNAIGCLVVLNYPQLKVVHSLCEHTVIEQPYVPGYLAFREGSIMISLVQRLKKERPDLLPQVLFVDGNGLLHPDRFGLACHVGVLVDIPTIGVAKDLHRIEGIQAPSRGRLNELRKRGAMIAFKDNNNQFVGAALRTTNASKHPVYVSVGHRITLGMAVKLTTLCSRYRIPEPTRKADIISREQVRKVLQ